jgi:hypothetical protein
LAESKAMSDGPEPTDMGLPVSGYWMEQFDTYWIHIELYNNGFGIFSS